MDKKTIIWTPKARKTKTGKKLVVLQGKRKKMKNPDLEISPGEEMLLRNDFL